MFEKFIAAFFEAELGNLLEYEPIAKYTTLRVGGPARIIAQPKDKCSFVDSIKLARELKMEIKILGKGSNLLASDNLFEGIIFQTDKCLKGVEVEGTIVTVGAGVSDIKLARDMAKLGFSGLEFLSGVPGTIGGAVFMNAGAYLKEISDILLKVEILNEKNEIVWLDKEELGLSYRTSVFQKNQDWIILGAALQLELGDACEILETIKSRKEKRLMSQPIEMPSAGSTFRNPEGYAAWKLIADAGLRGYVIGGAKVSEKHTNFIVNFSGATAQDIVDVMNHVQKTVYEKDGVKMHQEVEFFNWG